VLALQPRPLHRFNSSVLEDPTRGDSPVTAEPQLFELHELARERGIDGYRLLSKAELMEAVGDLPPPGPTVVETAMSKSSSAGCRRMGMHDAYHGGAPPRVRTTT
jgi:hypothetical protein